MANPPIGNSFIEGPLGVVQLEFDGLDLGLTTDATELEFIEDMVDIVYQQYGTQPYDKIPSGQAYRITCTLGQVTPAIIAKLARGITVSGTGKGMKFGSDLYRSARTNFAKVLKVKRVDSEGDASADSNYIAYFYLAIPMITGPVSFESGTQRGLTVEFFILKEMTKKAFGYFGYPSSLGL
jgi:hypothetical protein